MKYINRTGITTPIGKIVKLDRDGRGVVLPLSSDISVLGVVISGTGAEVEVVADGVRYTFIKGTFRPGNIVYLRKSGQPGAMGSCYASSSAPAVPYVRIGAAIESGSNRMTRVQINIGSVSSGSAVGAVDYEDLINMPTSLSDINSEEGGKLDGIDTGSYLVAADVAGKADINLAVALAVAL